MVEDETEDEVEDDIGTRVAGILTEYQTNQGRNLMEKGHDEPITQIRFRGDPGIGVDVVRLAELRQRIGPELDRFERLDFTMYMLPTRGVGAHLIDFEEQRCEPGTLVRVLPGHVHRFSAVAGLPGHEGGFDAELLLIHPRAQLGAMLYPDPIALAPTSYRLDELDTEFFAGLIAVIRSEMLQPSVSRVVVRGLVGAWTGGVARLEARSPRIFGGTARLRVARFTRLVEQNFASWRTVGHYADALACSAKTLTRDCAAVTGQTPKQILAAHLILEARRLLALSDRPVESIARELGFTEATNFGAQFRHVTGQSPSRFRASLRS